MNKENMISCKEYAEKRKKELKEMVSSFKRIPKLCVIQIGNDSASDAYIKGKIKDCNEVGIECEHVHIADYENFSQEDLLALISEENEDDTVDGIIVQLPIPNKYNVEEVSNMIVKEKDVDGFRKDSLFLPCTPKGIVDWIEANDIKLDGKDVCIVGRSKIVGKPLADILTDKNATVTLCHSHTKQLRMKTSNADIVICAIGNPKMFDGSYFWRNTLIIDVGINRDENGKLCGDVDADSVYKSNLNCYVTPVPGGVGLLTRLALLENTVIAHQN